MQITSLYVATKENSENSPLQYFFSPSSDARCIKIQKIIFKCTFTFYLIYNFSDNTIKMEKMK